MAKNEKSNIETVFELFTSAAMAPRPYVEKKPIPASVTVLLDQKEMRMLHIVAARIGAPRTNVAHHVLKLGIHEAFHGCGFTMDEEGNIPDDQLKWDVAPRKTGFGFTGTDEEAA